eukprot:Sdes_comp15842_c0_seq4m4930
MLASEHFRPIPPFFEYANSSGRIHNSFTDSLPIVLSSESSMQDLNDRMVARNVSPVDLRHFRPNIVISGGVPWIEDTFKKIRIGNHVFDAVRWCERCSIPCVDADTGKRRAKFEPTPTLRTFRETSDQQVLFGINLIQHIEDGEIFEGDEVTVMEWKAPPLFLN